MNPSAKKLNIVADENIPFVHNFFDSFGVVKLLPARQITQSEVLVADVLLVRSVTNVNSGLLENSKVGFVGTATIGTDHIDTNYLKESSVFFTNASGSNAESVAEYVIASLLVTSQRKGLELSGKSIGIIGVGNIGSLVDAKAKALGMNVVLNDPPKQRETGDQIYRPLSEVLRCDFITCHVPLNKTGQDCTIHLIDEAELAQTSDNCVILNTSRGPVVNNSALKCWLKDNPSCSAIMDVWENEPRPDTELVNMVDIVTPHIAGYSFDGKVKGTNMLYDSLCSFTGTASDVCIDDFMPAPMPSEVVINLTACVSLESALAYAVTSVYDICTDDRMMREIVKLPSTEQGVYFDHLRKHYPVRREFSKIPVKINGSNPQIQASDLQKVLLGLGFISVKY